MSKKSSVNRRGFLKSVAMGTTAAAAATSAARPRTPASRATTATARATATTDRVVVTGPGADVLSAPGEPAGRRAGPETAVSGGDVPVREPRRGAPVSNLIRAWNTFWFRPWFQLAASGCSLAMAAAVSGSLGVDAGTLRNTGLGCVLRWPS